MRVILYLNYFFSSIHSPHQIIYDIYDTDTYIFLFAIDVSLFLNVHSNKSLYSLSLTHTQICREREREIEATKRRQGHKFDGLVSTPTK